MTELLLYLGRRMRRNFFQNEIVHLESKKKRRFRFRFPRGSTGKQRKQTISGDEGKPTLLPRLLTIKFRFITFSAVALQLVGTFSRQCFITRATIDSRRRSSDSDF